ncbi:hypothetical protein ACLK11_14715 [Escherichia coli]
MSHKPAHLLLVDDDRGLLKRLGLLTQPRLQCGHGWQWCAEGLRVLNREKDPVISDLRMDEMDDISRSLKSRKCEPGTPVTILTAHGSSPMPSLQHSRAFFSFLDQACRQRRAISGN